MRVGVRVGVRARSDIARSLTGRCLKLGDVARYYYGSTYYGYTGRCLKLGDVARYCCHHPLAYSKKRRSAPT